MRPPYFAEQIEQYTLIIDELSPEDPRDTVAVARATLFAVHHAIVGHGSELLENITDRFAGKIITAHVYGHRPELVAIGDGYVIHQGASNFPHLSFTGSDIKFGVDPSGQPLFAFSADLVA